MHLQFTIEDLPTAIMALAGIVLLLIALKAQDPAAIKLLNALIALGLLTAAMWWYIHCH